MSLSIKGKALASCSMGSNTAANSDIKVTADENSALTDAAAFAKSCRRSLDLAVDQASLQLVSRELSDEAPKHDASGDNQTAGATPASTTQPTSSSSTWTGLPRPDRTVSWADVDDSDSDEDASFAVFHSPGQALIPSFSGDALHQYQDGPERLSTSTDDSPSPLAPPVAPSARSISSDEPVQTHFGFNLLSLGAVPEDAELTAGAMTDDASDPDNRVSVLISGGAADWSKGQQVSAPPRQHGYAGVLTMLHRSVSTEITDPPANGLAVTSARIEAVLPVGQDERVRFHRLRPHT